MKKFICLSSIISILFISLTIGTSAAQVPFTETSNSIDKKIFSTPLAPTDFYADPLVQLMYGEGEKEQVSVFASIIVNVNSPCDQRWRSKYPNSWMYEADRAVEDADEIYYKYYYIDFRSVSQQAWNSTAAVGDGNPLLYEAKNNYGLNGADIMIAFSGAYSGYGGWGERNGSYCIVFDYGYQANASVTRHETGHLYGCKDHYNDIPSYPYACFMNDLYTQYNNICRNCDAIIAQNRYKF